MVGVTGKIHTDSYEKDGKKIYTTDIQADRVEFIGRNNSGSESSAAALDNPFDAQEDQVPRHEGRSRHQS